MTTAKQVDLVKGDEDVSSEPLYLHLSITDPEVVAALTDAGEGRDRQEFAQTALRIGGQLVQRDQVLMPRIGQRAKLTLETQHRISARLSENFQGDSPQTLGAIEHLIHRTRAARAKLAHHRIPGTEWARRVRQGRRTSCAAW